MLYLREDIVIEELQDDGNDDTEDSGNQRHLHTLSHDGRTDVARSLNAVEGHHHTYHRTKETQRRCHGNKQAYPRTALFHIANLHGTVVRQLAVYLVQRLLDVQQSLIADAGHGSARIATEVFGTLHVALFQTGIDVLHQLLRIDFRQRQVDQSLNTKRQTQYQRQGHQRHETCRAFHELTFQLLMQATASFLNITVHAFQVGSNQRHGRVCRQRVLVHQCHRVLGFPDAILRHSRNTHHQACNG